MIEASARLDAVGRALAYPIHGGNDRADRSTHNGGHGVNTLADPAETTRNTDPSATGELHDLLRRAEGEYREMPGLSLTVPQAARLWGLDSRTCATLLTTLADRQVLTRTTTGTYLRGSGG